MTTKVELARDGTRTVWHERRRDGRGGAVTHSWTHAADDETRHACEACMHETLPAAVRRGSTPTPAQMPAGDD